MKLRHKLILGISGLIGATVLILSKIEFLILTAFWLGILYYYDTRQFQRKG